MQTAKKTIIELDNHGEKLNKELLDLAIPNNPDVKTRAKITSILRASNELMTQVAFDFLNKTAIQINRPGGFSELFAVSLSNVPTNLVVTNISDESINPDYPVVGFFNISSVHGMGNTLDDDEIEKIELYNREW